MLKRVCVLLLLAAIVGVFFGCTYNYSDWNATSSVRRLAIAGEDLRLVQQDIDRLIGVDDYPRSGRWSH